MRTEFNKIIFCFSLFTFVFFDSAFSQAKPKVKKTFRADVLLPRPLSNKAFDTLFSGVYNLNLSMNFGVKNFNTGIFIGSMQCQIFPKFQSDPHAIQSVKSAGLRLSYDIYPSKAKMAATEGNFFVFSPFLCSGYTLVDYSRLKCMTGSPEGKHSQTYSIYGGLNMNIMFSEYDGVGFTLGYMYLNHEFNPDPLCLTQFFPNIPDKYKHGVSQYFMFGFNWYIDLVKRDNGTSQ